MFIQVITGKVVDEEGFRRQGDLWETNVRPGATGYLGNTVGVTDDGRFFAAARFDSNEAARLNSDRPEQSAWWGGMEKCVTDVDFHDCNKITTLFGGGSDDATFVQVMRGHITDRSSLEQLEARSTELEAALHAFRPDLLGEVIAYHDDGDGYTDIVYFTSEAEARANEQHEPPGDVQQFMELLMNAVAIDEYFDLRNPDLR
jgi:hypothetical protein